MKHTNLFKNEIYLIITSVISIGVLSGFEYFNLALAALLIGPVVNLPTIDIISKQKSPTSNLDECVSCE
ncbi:MAG: hypothetical protein QNL62_11580 [Gammaproteobacteria bacterium]|nr:hypothetical protein [Gammaproteobacteria bacterium]